MRTIAGLFALVVALGVIGAWASVWGRARDSIGAFDTAFTALLWGIGVASCAMIVLVAAGVFSAAASALAMVAIAAWGVIRARRSGTGAPSARVLASRPLAALLVIAALVVAVFAFLRPFDARLNSADVSLYLAGADRLADAGSLIAPEPLVSEMTPAERRTLFAGDLFYSGRSGAYYHRFPGGVQLLDPASDRVSFNFFHLWPAWLAIGLRVMGDPGFLAVLSLFAALSLAAMFFMGNELGDGALGITAVVLVGSSFPQIYYSRLPASEVPAQALFLCGLLALLRAIAASGHERWCWQLLAGLLWAAMFCMRLDAAPIVVTALAVGFAASALRRSFFEWTAFAVLLTAGEGVALMHAIAANSYDFGAIQPLGFVAPWIRGAEPAWIAVWLGIAALAFAASRPGAPAAARRGVSIAMATIFAGTAVAMIAWFAHVASWSAVVRHMHWIEVYVPSWLLLTMAPGLVLLALAAWGRPSVERARLTMLAAFVAISLGAFLIAPMVRPEQPWAIRRLVPMALPLAVVASIVGWRAAFALAARRSHAMVAHGYLVLGLLAIVAFRMNDAMLWRQPLYEDVAAQLHQLANRIPRGALVVMPDFGSGMQVHAALQYREHIDTLIMPVHGGAGTRDDIVRAYLDRQLVSGRPVIALVPQATLAPDVLTRYFALAPAFSQSIGFGEIPQAGEFELAPPSRVKSVLHAFAIAREAAHAATTIKIGLAPGDVPYLVSGFFGPEGDAAHPDSLFRWSTGEAEIRVPPARTLEVDFNPGWRPPQAGPLDVVVTVEGRPVASKVVSRSAGATLQVSLPEPGDKRSLVVKISCRPFSPAELGLSPDARTLGVPVFGLRLLS